MSLLWRLVFTSRCASTHHKLAMDSLRFLRGPMADVWSNLFLANYEQYLTGSKAPDDVFKDFKNHVLHVEQNFWGGATLSARAWYTKTVTALNQGNWPDAIYNAGVLSHYFTDPFQPFHTDQCEAEGKVHRAAEWSIAKSYEELQTILEHDLGGYPQYELSERPDWLEEAIRVGAMEAHASYRVCIDHYDLSRGIKNPPSGLDQEMKDRLARLIGLASVGFSRVLERAFEEAAVTPPDVAISLHAFLATLKIPLNWIMRKIIDAHERAIVESIYLEVHEKGKAVDSLPEDEKVVRKLHAQEVLRIPMRELDAEPAGPTGSLFGTGTPSRGVTAKTVHAGAFERTTVSAPLRFDSATSLEGSHGLETCLMVPLAANNPIDHVADTALRALLSQPPTQQSSNVTSAEAQVGARWLNRGSLPKLSDDSDGGLPTDGRPADSRTERNVLPPPSGKPLAGAPSSQSAQAIGRSKLDASQQPKPDNVTRDEKRQRRKKSKSPASPYPELSPPSPMIATSPSGSQLGLSDTPFDQAMFSPLPPMPRIKSRDPETQTLPEIGTATSVQAPFTSAQPGVTGSTSKPQSPADSAVRQPQRSVPHTSAAPKTPATQRPETQRPASQHPDSQRQEIQRPAFGATRPTPPLISVEPRSQGSHSTTEKSYVAEPASSPIPNPHIRTDDVPSDSGPTERSTQFSERQAPTGQPLPRAVVAASPLDQPRSELVNRLSHLNFAPQRTPSLDQAHGSMALPRPQVVNFDFQTSSGHTSSPLSQVPNTNSARSDVPKTPKLPPITPSSLFANLNASTLRQAETDPERISKPTGVLPRSVSKEANTTAPRPNIFQRPLPASTPIAHSATTLAPAPALEFRQPVTPHSEPQQAVEAQAIVPAGRSPEQTNQQAPVEQTAAQMHTISSAEEASSTEAIQSGTVDATERPQRARRFYLGLQSPLKEAPSIGPKSAELFETIGVKTVFDLLRINTVQAAEKLNRSNVTSAVIKDLQAQALLVCRVPELRGHDAQFLVGCGVRTAEQLANCEASTLLVDVQKFVGTPLGQRFLRNGKVPDLDEVKGWIASAHDARSLRDEK
jgi:hypothetical protein